MNAASMSRIVVGVGLALAVAWPVGLADETPDLPRAFVDGSGLGWRALGGDDFETVNGEPDTWVWKDGAVHGTGLPVGVARTKKPLKNFELVARWRHLKSGGNSGFFVWVLDSERSRGLGRGCSIVSGSRCRYSTTASQSNRRSGPARRGTGSTTER